MTDPAQSEPKAAPQQMTGRDWLGALAIVAVTAGAIYASIAVRHASPLWGEISTLVGLALLYVAPTILAFRRKHHNRQAIAALNLLAGWTVVGWIAALVWALTRKPPAS